MSNIMENNLKPCPLCGTTERLTVYSGSNGEGIVECKTPHCPMIIKAVSIEEAVEKWNKRPIEDELNEKLQIAIEALGKIADSLTLAALTKIEK